MLAIRNLCYSQPSNWLGKPKDIVKNLSLTVRPGEAFGFLGHNGAGKTTTIKCILGLLRPAHGEVLINGFSYATPSARRRIGYVAEQPYFYDHLTVLEALKLFATLSGVSKAQRSERVDRVLSLLKISEYVHSRLRTLSKGLLQRVALAQALVHEPSLLILDEPFSGLDPIGRREFMDIFLEEKAKGTTLFICTHILNDVERLCSRASILVQGELKGIFELASLPTTSLSYELELVCTLSQSEALAHKAIERYERDGYTTLQFAQRSIAESALRAALNEGLEVSSFGSRRASLEDVFNNIVSGQGIVAGDVR